MAIFGTLLGIATPYYATYRGKAQVARAVADMRVMADEILSHVMITGLLPDSLVQLNLDHMRDPWGRPYQYLRIEGGDPKNKAKPRKDRFLVPVNTDFDLYSMGPDGLSVAPFTAEESRDDIVRASNGGFYGEAALF
jgi:general secretion pathway protein G